MLWEVVVDDNGRSRGLGLAASHDGGMHFDVTDKIIKALPKTVKATGSDGQDAMTNLQTAADTYGADAKTAIDTATTDYDNTTGHGKTQDAVGGVNVELNCP